MPKITKNALIKVTKNVARQVKSVKFVGHNATDEQFRAWQDSNPHTKCIKTYRVNSSHTYKINNLPVQCRKNRG